MCAIILLVVRNTAQHTGDKMTRNQVEISELHTPTEHAVGFIFDVAGFTPRLILWTKISTAKLLANWMERWMILSQFQVNAIFNGDNGAYMIMRPGVFCVSVEVFDGVDTKHTTVSYNQAAYIVEEIGKVSE